MRWVWALGLCACTAPAGGRGESSAERAIRELDDFDIGIREAAQERLRAMGPAALPEIRAALRQNPSEEVRIRLLDVLPVAEADARLRSYGEAPVRVRAFRSWEEGMVLLEVECIEGELGLREVDVLAAFDDRGKRLVALQPRGKTRVLAGLSPKASRLERLVLAIVVNVPTSNGTIMVRRDDKVETEVGVYRLAWDGFSASGVGLRIERDDGEDPDVEDFARRVVRATIVDSAGNSYRASKCEAEPFQCLSYAPSEDVNRRSRRLWLACKDLGSAQPESVLLTWVDRQVERSFTTVRRDVRLLR